MLIIFEVKVEAVGQFSAGKLDTLHILFNYLAVQDINN